MKRKGYYSSGQFAGLAGVTVRTIRYYDKMNLLKPSMVTDAGARFYTDYDLVRLQQILLLKYLGFSLDDIKLMPTGQQDNYLLKSALSMQKKLIAERLEEMRQVEAAIDSTLSALVKNEEPDWRSMLELIHLTAMENSLKNQYQNASNISARIRLHDEYSVKRKGWFPWIFEQCELKPGMRVLELGCGNGALWTENINNIIRMCNGNVISCNGIGAKSKKRTSSGDENKLQIVLSDISAGILRDAKRSISECINECEVREVQGEYIMTKSYRSGRNELDSKSSCLNLKFDYRDFDCSSIPYPDESFDLVIANHVLFYCDDLDAVCAEVKRVLKKGGRFICSTYSDRHMKEIRELVREFDDRIVLSGETLYDKFGLDNGQEILQRTFNRVEQRIYDDEIILKDANPLIEYILSCHGNQNQYILDRYNDFKNYVVKQVGKEFHITKDAGIFICFL